MDAVLKQVALARAARVLLDETQPAAGQNADDSGGMCVNPKAHDKAKTRGQRVRRESANVDLLIPVPWSFLSFPLSGVKQPQTPAVIRLSAR